MNKGSKKVEAHKAAAQIMEWVEAEGTKILRRQVSHQSNNRHGMKPNRD
jgi:hypothetical protein